MAGMSRGFSFTVDLEQESVQPSTSGSLNSEESTESSRPSSAWEINFNSGDQGSQKKSSLPKFLRDRERNRSSSSATETKPKTKIPSRSFTSPLKARDPKPIARPPSKSNTSPPKANTSLPKSKISPPRHSNSSPRLGSPHSLSPKKSPTIKKPLLPVASPTSKSPRMSDLKSRSDCSLTKSPRMSDLKSRSDCSLIPMPNKRSVSKRTRPHSAAPSLELAWRESRRRMKRDDNDVDARGEAAQGEEIASRSHDGLRSERTTSNLEMPKASKSLPVVTLGDAGYSLSHSKLASIPEEMAQRKVMDLKRWYCMCHPQYSKSCGISSVVSCWNYLFSTLGNGSLPPLTQEKALTLLGFKPPFGEIKFGPFTGNITCMRWFQRLCDHFGVGGQAYYFYKPVGRRRTAGINPSMALERFQDGLRCPDTAFVYHCSNHYFCPIGYEQVPKKATDAYGVGLRPDEVDTWVLIGEPSRKHPAIHCVKWDHIVQDLTCESPKHFNIRHVERGVVVRNTKRKGGNIHCIMAMKRARESVLATMSWRADGGTEDRDEELVSESDVEDLDSSDSDYPREEIPHRASTNASTKYLEVWTPYEATSTNLGVDLDSIDVGTMDTPNACDSTTQEGAGAGAGAGVSIRRSGTFTKDRPTLEVKLTRKQSTDSEHSSVDDEDSVDNPQDHLLLPVATGDGTTPTDSTSGLRRSGTFTKDAPTVHVERTRAWSSEEDSDSSQHTKSSHDEELGLDVLGQVDSKATYTVETAAMASYSTDTYIVEKSAVIVEPGATFQSTNLSSRDEESNSTSETCSRHAAPPESRERRGTYTKDEPSLVDLDVTVSDLELDLDTTLKASDYAAADDDLENT